MGLEEFEALEPLDSRSAKKMRRSPAHQCRRVRARESHASLGLYATGKPEKPLTRARLVSGQFAIK